MRLEAENVMSLELRVLAGAALPVWQPGAHVDLVLPSGLVRQYSLCGDPQDRTCLRIAVLREEAGRGGSREVHDALRVGQAITLCGPRNAFELGPADDYLFVAGGIGITPLMPMVRAAQRANARWRLLYGGRTRASMAFVGELQTFGGERVAILPADETGLLDLDTVVTAARAGAQVYSCGPGALLDALVARFDAAGIVQQLHVERFGVAPSAASEQSRGELRVILARSGTHVDVPSDCSVMHALRAAGHEVSSSCEQGICGICETRVLDGVPDHRDQLLTESERQRGDVMMVCVSRALTPTLTLDL
ncbi:oxidoreductase [Burkholderia humptydooensis]|uniref:Oxidoreductase n=4 Tax=Burkholderia humptydooensis TaxID=430531 RepID=A0A7T2X0H8_9BURK|nr:putative oxidoreductase [Burkholderia humptydooensis MSMB43]QPS44945.1 oxidoreductase [Burkholderia humptydooensis]